MSHAARGSLALSGVFFRVRGSSGRNTLRPVLKKTESLRFQRNAAACSSRGSCSKTGPAPRGGFGLPREIREKLKSRVRLRRGSWRAPFRRVAEVFTLARPGPAGHRPWRGLGLGLPASPALPSVGLEHLCPPGRSQVLLMAPLELGGGGGKGGRRQSQESENAIKTRISVKHVRSLVGVCPCAHTSCPRGFRGSLGSRSRKYPR